METAWREPIEFTAGDTLSFKRSLSDYRASAGWSMVYEIRGQGQAIELKSTADGDNHVISADASVTANWLPGECTMTGFVVNGDQRQQIYYGALLINPNTPATSTDETEKTFAQQMIEQLELVMLAKAGNPLAISQIGESRFQYLEPKQLRDEHAYWVSVRKNEIAKLNAQNGRPTGYKTKTRFNVTPSYGYGTGVRLS